MRARYWLLGVAVFGAVGCEIADRTVTGAPAGGASNAGSGPAGSANGGSIAGSIAGGEAGEGSVAGQGATSATNAGGETGQGGMGGAPTEGGVANGGGGQDAAGAGGEPVVGPKACEPACEAPSPVCNDGVCEAPTSCSGLEERCGLGFGKCCESIQVPAGSFKRSFDAVTYLDESAGATVSAFALGELEVTVGRFRKFVQGGFGTREKPPLVGSGRVHGAVSSAWKAAWSDELMTDTAELASGLECGDDFFTWTAAVVAGQEANEARPINCVTWYEAQAFCIWDGGRLPSEAEWNYVAAAGNQQRAYPWSSPPKTVTISGALASYWVNPGQCIGSTTPANSCDITDLVTAGRKTGESLWGHRDLAGNVSEWTFDFYSPDYETPCIDCVEPNSSSSRVIRGGAFGSGETSVRASAREGQAPAERSPDTGFRCAYEGK